VGDSSRFSKAGLNLPIFSFLKFKQKIIDMVTTITGSVKGLKDDKGLNASFKYPWGMCLNPHDECLYICDSYNHAIRKLTMQGIH
jgi:hypothetical protein